MPQCVRRHALLDPRGLGGGTVGAAELAQVKRDLDALRPNATDDDVRKVFTPVGRRLFELSRCPITSSIAVIILVRINSKRSQPE